jgi:hypothetical protein
MMEMRGLVVAVVMGLVAMAGPAQAAEWSYAAWGWSEPAGPEVDFRWGEPFRRVRLNDRWTVRDCDGDAWFICFRSDAGGSGKAELLLFSLDSMPALQRDLAEGDRWRALRRRAYSHYRTFRDDRTDCREGYTFHPLRPRPATVAGRDGIRFGFVVRDASGRQVERTMTLATVTRDDFVVVGTEGLNRRSCLAIEGPTFTPRELKRMGPFVARLAATGRLPRR